jgi:hypothetical protein
VRESGCSRCWLWQYMGTLARGSCHMLMPRSRQLVNIRAAAQTTPAALSISSRRLRHFAAFKMQPFMRLVTHAPLQVQRKNCWVQRAGQQTKCPTEEKQRNPQSIWVPSSARVFGRNTPKGQFCKLKKSNCSLSAEVKDDSPRILTRE